MHAINEAVLRQKLENGATVGPSLWGNHNVWDGRNCVGRIPKPLFTRILPELVRIEGFHEARWRLQDPDHG